MRHASYPKSVKRAMHVLAVNRSRVAPYPLEQSILDLLEKSSSGYSPEEWLESMLKNLDGKGKQE